MVAVGEEGEGESEKQTDALGEHSAWGAPRGAGGTPGSQSGSRPRRWVSELGSQGSGGVSGAKEVEAFSTCSQPKATRPGAWAGGQEGREEGGGQGPCRGDTDLTCALPRPQHTCVGARYTEVLSEHSQRCLARRGLGEHLRSERRVFEALPNLASCMPRGPAITEQGTSPSQQTWYF